VVVLLAQKGASGHLLRRNEIKKKKKKKKKKEEKITPHAMIMQMLRTSLAAWSAWRRRPKDRPDPQSRSSWFPTPSK
jgi:hypothetical protein